MAWNKHSRTPANEIEARGGNLDGLEEEDEEKAEERHRTQALEAHLGGWMLEVRWVGRRTASLQAQEEPWECRRPRLGRAWPLDQHL